MSWSFLTRKFKIRQKIAPWNLSGSLVVLIIFPKNPEELETYETANWVLSYLAKNPKIRFKFVGTNYEFWRFSFTSFWKNPRIFFVKHIHISTLKHLWFGARSSKKFFKKSLGFASGYFWASENLANAFNVFLVMMSNTRCWGKTPETLKMNVKVCFFFWIWGLFWCFEKNPKCSSPNSELISMVLNLQPYNTNPRRFKCCQGWKVSSESKLGEAHSTKGQPQQKAT